MVNLMICLQQAMNAWIVRLTPVMIMPTVSIHQTHTFANVTSDMLMYRLEQIFHLDVYAPLIQLAQNRRLI